MSLREYHYQVMYPETPGGRRSGDVAVSLAHARDIAARVAARRADLHGTDIRIETADGEFIEYGPKF